MRVKIRDFEVNLLIAIVLIFATVFFLKAAQLHLVFSTAAYDFGIFIQNFWLLSTLNETFNTVRGLNTFGDHFQPIQILFAPLYRVMPSPLLLLLIQVAAVAWSAIILHRIANHLLPNHRMVAFAIALAYLINPVVHNPLLWQYHAIVLASPLFLLWLKAYLDRNDKRFFVFLILLLMVREDVSVITLSFGLVALYHRRWRLSIATILLSMAWWLLVSKIVMPHFNGEGYFRHEGYTVGALLDRIFDLQYYIKQLWENDQALRYLGFIFLPLLLLSFRSPVWLLPAFPTLLANILIGGYNTQIGYHYSVYAIPFVFMAAIMGIKAILKTRPRLAPLIGAGLLLATAWSSMEGSKFSIRNADNDWRHWERQSPLRELVSGYNDSLDPDIGISASDFLLPHFANRTGIYLFPNPWKLHYWGIRGERQHHPNQVDYILINPDFDWKHRRLLQYLQDEGYFEMEHRDRNIMVLRRLKPEPGDRLSAVAAANDYVGPDINGVKFGQALLSPPFSRPTGGFEAPPFIPGNNIPAGDWQPATSEMDGVLMLDLQPTTGEFVFAARYIYAPITVEESQDVEVLIGSDDTLEVWFEGKKILEHLSPRPVQLGDNHVRLRLKPGVNHLYFRVDNHGGAWRLIAKIEPLRIPQ